MTSIAVMRACGLLVTGAAGCEWVRRYDPKAHITPPTIVVHSSNHTPSYTKYVPYAVVGAGLLYFGTRRPYVTARQFTTACHALQSQVTAVSGALTRVKTIVLEKFGVVETRLNDIERTVLTKTAEIKRDVAHVETVLARMGAQVDTIEGQTAASVTGIELLCGVVASSLNNTLHDKPATAQRLQNHVARVKDK